MARYCYTLRQKRRFFRCCCPNPLYCYLAPLLLTTLSRKILKKALYFYTHTCYYNIRREVNDTNRKKRKPTKYSVNWPQTLAGALVDFIVGAALLLIAKLLE